MNYCDDSLLILTFKFRRPKDNENCFGYWVEKAALFAMLRLEGWSCLVKLELVGN